MLDKETLSTVENVVRQFIATSLMFVDGDPPFGNDDSLLDLGVIDSTAVLELVAFVEERFGIEVQDDEVLPQNFDSVSKLADYLRRKERARAAVLAI